MLNLLVPFNQCDLYTLFKAAGAVRTGVSLTPVEILYASLNLSSNIF